MKSTKTHISKRKRSTGKKSQPSKRRKSSSQRHTDRGSLPADQGQTANQHRPGTACCGPALGPSVTAERAKRLSAIASAFGDPTRLQIVDVLRQHAGSICACELEPLFEISQPTISHHLKVLREAGIIESERRGLWAYYFVKPDVLEELESWLGDGGRDRIDPNDAHEAEGNAHLTVGNAHKGMHI